MAKKGYRLSIFWEEYGTMNEGGIEDIRNIELAGKPSKKEMDLIEARVTEDLREGRLWKTKVYAYPDARYQPPIRSRCHPESPVKCWPTADGKGLRIECEQCGMLVIDFKIKSPIIRRQKPQ